MDRVYQYKGWEIRGFGGYVTIRRFWATKEDTSFWMFRLRDVRETINQLESGSLNPGQIPECNRKPLYN